MIRWFTRGIAYIARVMPESWVCAIGATIGWVWHWVIPIRRSLVRRQLEEALGISSEESRILARGVFRHLGICIAELFRYGTARGLEPNLRVVGEEHLHEAIAAGKGVLAVTGHLGNWEILARYGARLPARLSIVTRRLSLGVFQEMWEELREGGANLIPSDDAGRTIVRCLGRGEIVGFVLDQHAPESTAVTVDFLGSPAATSTGLVRAARLSGAPIIPLFSWREGSTHVISIGAPIPAEEGLKRSAFIQLMTGRCSDVLEDAVLGHPEQWLWLHRRWKLGNSGGLTCSESEVLIDDVCGENV